MNIYSKKSKNKKTKNKYKNMPRFDGTGPFGFGPGTGWGLGPCSAGMAFRRGLRRRFYPNRFFMRTPYFPLDKKEEKELLEEELEILEEEIKAIKERLNQLKDQK